MNGLKIAGGLAVALGLMGCDMPSGGSSSGTPTVAESACAAAVADVTQNPMIAVTSSEFSEAGTYVTLAVGEQKAPWKCIAYSDGSTDGVEFLGSEGAL
ncbi:hypothetical protein [Fluviibacterium sp. S390]